MWGVLRAQMSIRRMQGFFQEFLERPVDAEGTYGMGAQAAQVLRGWLRGKALRTWVEALDRWLLDS